MKAAKNPTIIANSFTPFFRFSTSAAVYESEVLVMSSSTLPIFMGSKLTDMAKQMEKNIPKKAWNFLFIV